jgi:hypothetical protein
MSPEGNLARDVEDRQVAMFAMFVGPGLLMTRAALAKASRISESTLKSWAGGAAMPLHAVLTLRKFLPAEAIHMMTEPGGARFTDLQASAANWDAIAADTASLTFEICEARKDGNIDHIEKARLRRHARTLVAELTDAIADD